MGTESMWGNIEEIEEVKTPVAYLREQADILSERTGHVLKGKTLTGQSKEKNFVAYMDIVVPSLNNYSHAVIRVEFAATIYPLVDMRDMINGKTYKCDNEEEFLISLKEILSSGEMMRLLSVLISQSKEQESRK